VIDSIPSIKGRSTMRALAKVAGLVLTVLILAVLFLFFTGPAIGPQPQLAAEAVGENEEPKEEPEKFASDTAEEDAFTVPPTAVGLTEAMSAAGHAVARELDGGVPVVNATFPQLPLVEFIDAMAARGVLFALSDPVAGRFYEVVSTAPYRFRVTAVEALAAVNPRYCRISCDTGETRELLASWRKQTPAAQGADILMFVPKRLEYAVLGSLASADPPPAAVASYHGEYRIRLGGLRLEITGAVTKHGDTVAMGRLIDF
jgi:hypothetical protein